MDFNISSKLLERMWETVEKTGIVIFRPWVMKRDAKARLHIENLDKISKVQLEKRIKLLKQDSTTISTDIDSIEKKLVQDPSSVDVDAKVRKEPYLNIIAHQITENMVQKELQKEINLANTLKVTAEILSQDGGTPPKEQVEQDWMTRFREVASNTTTEEIQQLWGKILAGEIKSPGKHSLRTLEFIKNLSKEEALQIEKLYRFIIGNGFMVKGFTGLFGYESDILNSKLSFDYLLNMQSFGLILGVEGKIKTTCTPTFTKERSYFRFNFRKYAGEYDYCYFTHNDKDKKLEFATYVLTKLGEELRGLCHIEVDEDYLNSIIKLLEDRGYK